MSLPPPFIELSFDEQDLWFTEQGFPAFRVKQVREWIYQRRAKTFNDMNNVPKLLREKLSTDFSLFPAEIDTHLIAKDHTEKLLLKLRDGQHIECVLMREPERNTVCISTQVGCGMGCVFCASGMLGLKRNLSKSEILQQILLLDRVQSADEKITNIVVMGIGEPLANLKNLLPALEIVRNPECLGLSPRRITISTVGLPDKIRELASLGIPYNLAVSLHAPNETLRTQIVPVNKNIGIENILLATDNYFEQTGRRITFEYVMLKDVNDTSLHARELGQILHKRNAHINLIPMNSVEPLKYDQPSRQSIENFVSILADHGTVATVRKRKGEDIDAACGQLRLKATQLESPQLADISLNNSSSDTETME